MPKTGRHKTGPDNLRYNLVSFSTFEELMLPIKGPMEDAWVVKHYEPSRTQCLDVNMVGRIPLMQCFLDGNTTPTIPARTRILVSQVVVQMQLQRMRHCSNVY
jgi:hypothetical protein